VEPSSGLNWSVFESPDISLEIREVIILGTRYMVKTAPTMRIIPLTMASTATIVTPEGPLFSIFYCYHVYKCYDK